MSLLTNLMEHPLDEGYAAASESGQRGRWHGSRFHPLPVIALVAVGFLLAVAAVQNYRSALQASGLGAGGATELQRQLEQLELDTGLTDTTGPGLKLVVDDAKNATDDEGKVLDVDLQQLVNGLWAAGAEAISVNGHRLTSLTAIRGAGTAITVDYSSLSRPYVVQAIGDPATLPARFSQTAGCQWMQYLLNNFGVRMTPTSEDSLLVPGDSSISLSYAKGAQR